MSENPVFIYSGEHMAYWRPNAAGYTKKLSEAGQYSRNDAEGFLAHAGPEKRLTIRTIESLMNISPPMKFRYRNYKGEIEDRTVDAPEMWFGSTKWHPERQWLMKAFDWYRLEFRDFAVKDILYFGDSPPT